MEAVVEFMWWWVVCKVIFVSNPTTVLRLCCVVTGAVTTYPPCNKHVIPIYRYYLSFIEECIPDYFDHIGILLIPHSEINTDNPSSQLTTNLTMEQNTFFLLILPLLLNLGAEGAFVPEAPVHWLPSGHGFDSGSIFNSWNKAMKNYLKYSSPYRTMQRVFDDDKDADLVQVGINKKIPALAEKMNEIGLLRFGKRGH